MESGWQYKEVLSTLLERGNHAPHMQDLLLTIRENGFSRQAVAEALRQYGIEDITYYKEDMLDLLLSYLNIILDDHAISETEYRDFGLFKLLFRVQEGDFYKKRHQQVEVILHRHFSFILEDGIVQLEEALETVNLLDMFGLSQDQFEEFEASYDRNNR
jgi:hypothetical protein